MKSTLTHDTFSIERTFRANRQRAFRAWSDVDQKAKWFVGPPGKWSQVRREMDFKVGGEEIVCGAFGAGGSSGFYALYQDIVDQERIVYSYRMYVDEELFSISQVTVEFFDEGAGSKTVFTEQGVYFGDPAGAAGRVEGSNMLMDNIVNFLDQD